MTYSGKELSFPLNAFQIKQLASDLSPDAVFLVMQLEECQAAVEDLHYDVVKEGTEARAMRIIPSPSFLNQIRKIGVSFEALTALLIEVMRKNARTTQERDLPKLIPKKKEDKFKDENKEELEIVVPETAEAWEVYLSMVVDDIHKLKHNIDQRYETGAAEFIDDVLHLTLYLREIDSFNQTLASALSRAKKDWYKQIRLKPYDERKQAIQQLNAALEWRLKNLNEASNNLLEYLKQPVKKNMVFVKQHAFNISGIYKNSVYDLVNDASVGKLHASDEFKPLNTLLQLIVDATKDENAFEKISVAEITALEVKEWAAHSIVKQCIQEFNYFYPKGFENQLIIDLRYATQCPFNNYLEKTLSVQERKALFLRPTLEDQNSFWGVFAYYLLTGSGHAVNKERTEGKEKIKVI